MKTAKMFEVKIAHVTLLHPVDVTVVSTDYKAAGDKGLEIIISGDSFSKSEKKGLYVDKVEYIGEIYL